MSELTNRVKLKINFSASVYILYVSHFWYKTDNSNLKCLEELGIDFSLSVYNKPHFAAVIKCICVCLQM